MKNEYKIKIYKQLDEEAVVRLNKFNLFISDTTSRAYNEAKEK